MSTKIGLGVPVPQLLPVTGTWTFPFAAYFILLSNRIVYHRLTNKQYMGHSLSSSSSEQASDPLYIASRAHGNFVENVPLALIFAAVAEVNGADRKTLNYALAAFFALRVLHVEMGLMVRNATGPGRIVGYYGTQLWMALVGGWSSWLAKGYWGY